MRDHADEKIRALTIFANHRDNAIFLLSHKVQALDIDDPEFLQEAQSIIAKSDAAVSELTDRFPSLEPLVADHEDHVDFGISPALGGWIEKTDHIQLNSGNKLRKQRNMELDD